MKDILAIMGVFFVYAFCFAGLIVTVAYAIRAILGKPKIPNCCEDYSDHIC